MKMRSNGVFLYYGLFLLSLFCSCDDDFEERVVPYSERTVGTFNFKAIYSDCHTMSEEDAHELVSEAISLFSDERELRSGKLREIENVRVLHHEKSELRLENGSTTIIPDTMAYVFNFADSMGFAIVCADDRVGCPLLAFVKNGSLNEMIDDEGLAIFLVNVEDFIGQSIVEFENKKDSLKLKADEYLFDNQSVLRKVYTGKYDLMDEKSVSPVLGTQWGQSATWSSFINYNKYTPYCPSKSENMPLGCTAVAVSQIMAHYEYPKSLDGYIFDWSGMKASPRGESVSSSNKEKIARFMRLVGSHIGMDYGCEGSSASIGDALSWMNKTFGYETMSGVYFWESVKLYLDLKIPVIMEGYATRKRKKVLGVTVFTKCTDGHAWVLDGYTTTRIRTYSYKVNTSTNESETKLISTDYTNSMVYVNWGWDGKYDGYYASDCFQPRGDDYNYQYKQKFYVAWR